MDRISEEELMNDEEQARAYAEADFSDAHDAFVRHFAERFPLFFEGEVLDIGCGPADVTIRFAQSFPRTRITGIDGAQAMLDYGTREIQKRGLTDRITLRKVYLPGDPCPDTRYDAVISNSLLHHLSDPALLWQSISSCSENRSPVFIMDLLRPLNSADADVLVHLYASDASPIVRQDFFNSLLAAYTVEEVRGQLEEYGLKYLQTEAVSDRHLVVWGEMRRDDE